MSLHHTDNVKEPIQTSKRTTYVPRSLRSGGLASDYVGDRWKREPVALTASVEWHLGASSESVNQKKCAFVIFLSCSAQTPGNGGFDRQASASPGQVSLSDWTCDGRL